MKMNILKIQRLFKFLKIQKEKKEQKLKWIFWKYKVQNNYRKIKSIYTKINIIKLYRWK